MKRTIITAILLSILCLSACGTHKHSFSDADCYKPATCSERNATEGEPPGHTSSVGTCQRCGNVQNEEILELLNTSFAVIMDEGSAVIECTSGIGTLSNQLQYEKFVEADNHITQISKELDSIILACAEYDELDRIVFQSRLLRNTCPTAITGTDDISLANQTILYQLFLQQISSSFNYLSEDMDYLAGNRELPNGISYFDEVEKMPTPDSVIFGITYDSEKSDAGVKQYMYLIGSNESDANMNYNNYLSAIDLEPTLEYELAESYAIVTKDGNMVSAMMAGTDPQKGYFLIISFQE